MRIPIDPNGFPMDTPMGPLYMDHLWSPYGPSMSPPMDPLMDPLWTPYGHPMDTLWTLYGHHMDTLWTPLWTPYGPPIQRYREGEWQREKDRSLERERESE